MSEVLPNQERLTGNTTHILLGSDCSVRYINHENTTLHVFREDREVDYCVEFQQPSGSTDRLYVNDSRVVSILDGLGFTIVLRPYATADHVDEYRKPENESRFTEWDVFDPIAKRSLILEPLVSLDLSGAGDFENHYEIPILVKDEVTVQYEYDGKMLDLNHGNTEVIEFDDESEHKEFSHICVAVGVDENDTPIVILIFDDEELREELKGKRFPKRLLPQISSSAVLEFIARAIESDFDEKAEEEFGIGSPDQSDD